KASLGIKGRLNTNGNDGTTTRFGWKAQNKSLLIFAGEAYNVEQGVSNELFMNERAAVPGCVFNSSPEDHTNNNALDTGDEVDMASDAIAFAMFMRLTAAPTVDPASDPQGTGKGLFNSVGCAACHTESLSTGNSPYGGMSNITYAAFSDFALHHMGDNLSDGIVQGNASGDMFRTAPLWGVGQRSFFLHDGRTADIVQAIEEHSSNGSEANAVVANFNNLSAGDQQLVVGFLRGL
ncbi:MAG TPA: di-heme oxidoredictase family protein, partial [Polyangiaceae bacterium]